MTRLEEQCGEVEAVTMKSAGVQMDFMQWAKVVFKTAEAKLQALHVVQTWTFTS